MEDHEGPLLRFAPAGLLVVVDVEGEEDLPEQGLPRLCGLWCEFVGAFVGAWPL